MTPGSAPFPAMVLAAGFGTRLQPHTLTTPKALVPVAGRPMIHYPLDWLQNHGIAEVIINLHHLGGQIEAALGDGSDRGLRISYSYEHEILGTGGGVAHARPLFGRRPLILINADTMLDTDLAALIDRHRHTGAVATLALVQAPDPENYTAIGVDDAGMVRSIGGKPGPAGDAVSYTYTGLALLEPELIDYLPADRFSHLAADGLIPALADGRRVAAYIHRGYWKALDNMERIGQAEADLAGGKVRTPG